MSTSPGAFARLGLLLFLFLSITVAFRGTQATKALPLDAPPGEFSGQRALQHSWRFAVEPRPAGSPALYRGRDYLVDQLQRFGAETEVQRVTVNDGNRAIYVENVLARIPGTANERPLVLTAHYDSVTWGPGAADDGAGCVVMLEAARALLCGPPLKHDIVLVFTSDEEHAGGGRRACLEHPWLQNMNGVIGFEGRGNEGPAFMFETSDGNLQLLRELARLDAPSNANSIMFEVHDRTPNNTDFGYMKHHGVLGYNVAFVGGLTRYHTANDHPRFLSPHTLQQMGGYAMVFARHYGNDGPKMEKSEENAVFFNTVGYHLVAYPAHWSRPIAVAAATAVLLALLVALWRKSASISGVLVGLFAPMLALVMAGALCYGLWRLGYSIHYVYVMYNGWYYHVAFGLLFISVYMAFVLWLKDRLNDDSLFAGALVFWLLVLAPVEYYVPIASYVVAWPAIFGALGLVLANVLRRVGAPQSIVALLLGICALPAIFFAVPGIYALYLMGATLSALGTAALALLLLILITPVWRTLLHGVGPRAALVPAGLGAALYLFAIACNGFSADHPKLNSLTYAANFDTGKALWLSTDSKPDSWTAQFFKEGQTSFGNYADLLPNARKHIECMRGEAPLLNIAPPQVQKLTDETIGEDRQVTFKVVSPRLSESVQLRIPGPHRVRTAHLEGVGDILADGTRGWNFEYKIAPASGEFAVRLTLDPGVTEPIEVQVIEEQECLPELTRAGYRPRPDWMIPAGNTLGWWENAPLDSERTLTVKTFSF